MNLPEFRNEPMWDFSRPESHERLRKAVELWRPRLPVEVPLVIGGARGETRETLDSPNPSRRRELVARSASATAEDADRAVAAAAEAFPVWSRTPAEERAGVLVRAAALMRERYDELTAAMMLEAGKTGAEAVADTNEAIDFLEFYAREALRLSKPLRMQPYLEGETNDYYYQALGVVGVIAPWNFPLAIATGMSCAALAAGNAVVLKPAEQTPLMAWLYIQIMEEAGLPAGALNLLPGRGEVCGARLVRHPGVQMVVFTGSREVGLEITRAAAQGSAGQNFIKRVVTEMGGKNGLIVDESADIASSIPAALHSAFGYSGQKCSAMSRLIVHEKIYDEYVEEFVKGARARVVGAAEEKDTQIGPLIDDEAQAKSRRYIELGRRDAGELHVGDVSSIEDDGYFVPPAVFEVDSGDHALMQEEIFGPVVAVLRVKDFDEGLHVANSTPYALTGGVHSRKREHLDRAREEFMVGNLYFNRAITGSIVNRQPFGGFRMSGIGSKAGGPDYLRQFLLSRVATERIGD